MRVMEKEGGTQVDSKQEWEHRRRQWEAVVNAGDLERYVDLVTTDLVWLPPGGAPILGRAAFREWLAPFLASFSYVFSTFDVRVRFAEGWAAEKAGFRSLMTPRSGGNPMAHQGTYAVLWRRDSDARWRIERYIDDTELSPVSLSPPEMAG